MSRPNRRPLMRFSPPLAALLIVCLGTACKNAPPAPVAPAIPFEQKLSWILRLEDQRVLRDPTPPPAPAPAPAKGLQPGFPPPTPDLVRLLNNDEDARVRRRAALAIGRVGLREGVRSLVLALGDRDAEVRQMAAFALGLLGDKAAVEPLTNALHDSSPLVQGRAAEALGMMGDPAAGPAIGQMIAAYLQSGALGGIDPDDLSYPLAPPVEACRLGVYALARLKAYEPLAAAVLDASGQPVVRWWPVAYALQRVEDRRAIPALMAFVRLGAHYGAAFGARGLGSLRDPSTVGALLPLLDAERTDPQVTVSAIRALAQIGDPRAAAPLLRLVQATTTDPGLRLEAVTALGALRADQAATPLLDLLSDPWPPMRAAALGALARIDAEGFIIILSGLDPDPQWSVRAALADIVTSLNPEVALPRLNAMLADADQRVLPAVLTALVKLRAPNAATVLVEHLKNDDVVVRMSAATNLGELKPEAGLGPLIDAYTFGQRDATYLARAAALGALAKYGPPATETLKAALADKDWAVRVRAAALLKELTPSTDYEAAIRPAPTGLAPSAYEQPHLVSPTVSPHVYVDTTKGTIRIELAVLDAPLTAENFMTLARKQFFNGLTIHRVVPNFVVQDGDPRGDGEGGPGYTIRDELNELPYLRGTVGMALDWKDTGGSQFFITHSPQPHLDARYTVFGRVIAGMDIVDRLQQWDAIRRVRVWDGTQMTAAK